MNEGLLCSKSVVCMKCPNDIVVGPNSNSSASTSQGMSIISVCYRLDLIKTFSGF